jgi:short subunit fatty acids transporter
MKTFKLDNEPKIESGFKTPDNYFENFSANLIQKLPIEPIAEERKVISIFRKRKNILMAVAAVLMIALMIPIIYQANTKTNEVDTATLENYLTEETYLNQDELIGEIEPESSKIITIQKEIETETLEDILVTNPNIENLVIEN